MNINKKEREKRKKLNFFRLLNDELFYKKLKKVHISRSQMNSLRTYKGSYKIPQERLFKDFINSYKFITNDKRSENEIYIWLLSESED